MRNELAHVQLQSVRCLPRRHFSESCIKIEGFLYPILYPFIDHRSPVLVVADFNARGPQPPKQRRATDLIVKVTDRLSRIKRGLFRAEDAEGKQLMNSRAAHEECIMIWCLANSIRRPNRAKVKDHLAFRLKHGPRMYPKAMGRIGRASREDQWRHSVLQTTEAASQANENGHSFSSTSSSVIVANGDLFQTH